MALTRISTDGVKDDAVTAGKIPANAVGTSEIAADAVTGAQIADDAIAAEHVADDAIGIAQLSATGTAGNTTYLRGDNTWTVVDTTIADDSVESGVISFSAIFYLNIQKLSQPSENQCAAYLGCSQTNYYVVVS